MRSALYIADADSTTGFREASFEQILAAARAALAARVRRGAVLTAPHIVREYLMVRLGDRAYESFTLLYLDSRYRLIAVSELFRGTVDGASIHPREVVKEALRHNAAAVLMAHCHPSGVAEPSQPDEIITRRLCDALALVDIRVLDHFIVAGGEVMSFADRGML